MSRLRSFLETLSREELCDLIDEIDSECEEQLLHARSGENVFREYLNRLSRQQIIELVDYANERFEGPPISKVGTQSELADRLIEDLRPSDLVECLDDCDLNGLVDATDKSGSKAQLIDRILSECDDELVESCMESLGHDAFEEDEEDLADDDIDNLGGRSGGARRRKFEVAPLRFDPLRAKKRGRRDYQQRALSELRDRYRKDQSGIRGYLYVATGGGKTQIANEFIVNDYLTRGKRVVWLTHNSYLLYQAASELCAQFGDRFGDPRDVLAAFGSENNGWVLHRVLDSYRDREFDSPPLLLYGTQASMRQATADLRGAEARLLRDFNPELVVIDEAHWGKSGTIEEDLYDRLFDGIWNKQNILGLSATPKVRQATGWLKKHVGNVSFAELVGLGYLARPSVVDLRIDVGTRISARDGIITNYAEIASNDQRNKAIVRHYQENRAKYGKSLFFAINREHADRMGQLLGGETALVIHGGRYDPHGAIDRFRNGHFDVAVVVNMAKEGVDIPELRTVVLCKPVTSQIEFAQMIGRASRRPEGSDKSHFYIVDCYDALDDPKIEAMLYHFQDYFTGASDRDKSVSRSSVLQVRNRGVLPRHAHDARVGLEFISIPQDSQAPADPALQLLHGLRINPKQTFGVELEFAPSGDTDITKEAQWLPPAKMLADALKKAVGSSLVKSVVFGGHADHEKWSVVHDGSCGWEVVSPILQGQDGFEQLLGVLTTIENEGVLRASGLQVNISTGFHVHLGWTYGQPRKVRRTLQFIRMVEPALFSLVAPSRVVESDVSGNAFCESIRKHFSDEKLRSLSSDADLMRYFGSHDHRYRLINLTKYDASAATSTAEIRLHNGTSDPAKVSLWVALWMNILSSIDHFDIPEIAEFSCTPEIALPSVNELSDIIWICNRYLGMETRACLPFFERLNRRRRECFGGEFWRKEMKKRRVDVDKILSVWDERLAQISRKLG
ncbi:MAG TPA: amidoligase family protein [Pseudobdellovibrionaceae bacterium]|nr:amidoligase family protein [Pseudobdellovibrionaceae bacterium]